MKKYKASNIITDYIVNLFQIIGISLDKNIKVNISRSTDHFIFWFYRLVRNYQFPLDEQITLMENFEIYRESSNGISGMNTFKALKSVKSVYVEMLGKDSTQVKVLQSMTDSLIEGKSYIDGMRDWFDEDFLMIYMSSMGAGKKGVEIRNLSKKINDNKKLSKEVRKSFLYPIFIFVVSILFTYTVSDHIIPSLSDFAGKEEINGIWIYIVQMFTAFIKYFGFYIIFFLLIIYSIYKISLPIWYGKKRAEIDNYFPYSVHKDIQSARFINILALMRQSDLNMKLSLSRIKEYLTPYLAWHADQIEKELYTGKGNYFSKDLLSKYQLIRLHNYSIHSSKSVPESLIKISDTAYIDAVMSIKDTGDKIRMGIFSISFLLVGITLIAFVQVLSVVILKIFGLIP